MIKYRFILISILLIGLSQNNLAQEPEITFLNPDNFQIEYQSEVFAFLIDVRMKMEYRKGHIPGAKHLPKKEDLQAFTDSLDRETPIYVYCAGTTRAGSAAEYLQSQEFKKIIILDGGFGEWKACELPVEKGRKAPCFVKTSAGRQGVRRKD